jgi:DNA modification methylase
MTVEIITGDCLDELPKLPAESAHCCVTSPPYWGLRDYGIAGRVWGGEPACNHSWGESVAVNATNHTDKRRWNHTRNGRDEEQPVEKRVGWKRQTIGQGQFCQKCGAWFGALGLEPTPDLYCEHILQIFAAVRGAMRPDATLWINIGDSYNAYNAAAGPGGWAGQERRDNARPKLASGYGLRFKGLKPKDLVGIPWRIALALQADGWYLRQDIIWHKPNPMPESVTDRCTKAHEYIFLLSKSERYFFNQELIREPLSTASIDRLSQPSLNEQAGSYRVPGKTNGPMKAVARKPNGWSNADNYHEADPRYKKRSGNKRRKPASDRGVPVDTNGQTNGAVAGSVPWEGVDRNKRSVWTVTTKPCKDAHFATFPPDLIKPCILAGCPEGGTVLDPFFGSGTTGIVASQCGCNCIGIELNPEYVKLAKRRNQQRTFLTEAP